MSDGRNGFEYERWLSRVAKGFCERNRYEISLVLGFLLLFMFLGFIKQPERPWTDWFFFIVGVMAVAIFTRRFVFPLSPGALYAPVIGWWVFAIGMNINKLVETGYGALYLIITLCIWGATYKLCILVERRKDRV